MYFLGFFFIFYSFLGGSGNSTFQFLTPLRNKGDSTRCFHPGPEATVLLSVFMIQQCWAPSSFLFITKRMRTL